jgi:nitrogen fixation protein NifZ
MNLEQLEPGDMVYAATDIFNDGSIPHLPTEAQLATAGTRGVLLNTGHLEEQPNKTVYLVRFEDQNRELGPPVTCWAEELSVEE